MMMFIGITRITMGGGGATTTGRSGGHFKQNLIKIVGFRLFKTL